MVATSRFFYVTLFSDALRDIYEQNTHSDITVKLTKPLDLGSTSNWEVGVCEITCSSSPHMGDNPALIYCTLISPQFVGDSTVPCMRTYVFP